MELLEVIKKRQSIRNFSTEVVSESFKSSSRSSLQRSDWSRLLPSLRTNCDKRQKETR